jgi:hypothetical protein
MVFLEQVLQIGGLVLIVVLIPTHLILRYKKHKKKGH